MPQNKPSLILINPWIYDFAAYDFWSKPLGLLCIATYLRHCGFKIHLIDCLDVYHPQMWSAPLLNPPKRRLHGTGKFWREVIPKPSPLRDSARPYSRYGLSSHVIENEMKKIKRPLAILVTSLMTYWYPGVAEVTSIARRIHPGVPILLGGIYARLCEDHAMRVSGADMVVSSSDFLSTLEALRQLGVSVPGIPPESGRWFPPAFELLGRIEYICLLTSRGCPCHCSYCAATFLNPEFIQRDPGEVLDEILYWHNQFDVHHFAFYDDALLVAVESHLIPILEELATLQLNITFHIPNAIHARKVTPEIAALMRRTGFRTVRLGLETSDFTSRSHLDSKIAEGEFGRAVKSFLRAGFSKGDIGAYVMVGLPGQSVQSVEETIEYVAEAGAVPFLSEYSPIPHTAIWPLALKHSKYDLSSEPLFHNNTLLPCWDEGKQKALPRLKKRILEIRQKYNQGIHRPPAVTACL